MTLKNCEIDFSGAFMLHEVQLVRCDPINCNDDEIFILPDFFKQIIITRQQKKFTEKKYIISCTLDLSRAVREDKAEKMKLLSNIAHIAQIESSL